MIEDIKASVGKDVDVADDSDVLQVDEEVVCYEKEMDS